MTEKATFAENKLLEIYDIDRYSDVSPSLSGGWLGTLAKQLESS